MQLRVLYDPDTIAARCQAIAQAIAAGKPRDLLVIAILKGSFIFAADLIRALHHAGLSPEVEFLHLASYHDGTQSTGKVEIRKDIESAVEGRDVLLIDDILESGRTLSFASSLVLSRGAARALVAVLLEKPGKRAVTLDADYVGFVCPDLFVVGYGMDMARRYRELPFIGVVEGHEHEEH